jgi:hypothetical protein
VLTSTPRRLLTLAVLAIGGVLCAAAISAASPATATHTQRLVVRGDDTVLDHCDAQVCRFELSGGAFRGTPVGTGAYTGTLEFKLADIFPNGEGGVCAPIRGSVVLGAGSPDRLTLAVSGDSCQDGAGNPAASSFTGIARFTVKHGTGAYAKARGSGVATFLEDAADHERMTLIGRIAS